jgi:hypothetical protein
MPSIKSTVKRTAFGRSNLLAHRRAKPSDMNVFEDGTCLREMGGHQSSGATQKADNA